jgi:ABC-type nitrate/sulfonate/bicarbonate transport system permease component
MTSAWGPLARLLRGLEFLLALAVVVLLWHLAAAWVGKRNVLPSPAAVGAAWVELIGDSLPVDAIASLMHLGAGYGLGVTTGLLLAVACARWAVVEAALDPLIELLRPIGAIAWIPLAILMFGIGAGVPIFLIFYASTFPIFVNTLAGIRGTDRRLVQAAEMLGASRRMVVTHVVMPAALPLILSGARLSLGVAWASMVAAELTGADAGLGWRIFWYQEFFAMDRVMAVILTIGVLGYALDLALRALQRRLTRWSPDSEVAAR